MSECPHLTASEFVRMQLDENPNAGSFRINRATIECVLACAEAAEAEVARLRADITDLEGQYATECQTLRDEAERLRGKLADATDALTKAMDYIRKYDSGGQAIAPLLIELRERMLRGQEGEGDGT